MCDVRVHNRYKRRGYSKERVEGLGRRSREPERAAESPRGAGQGLQGRAVGGGGSRGRGGGGVQGR